MSMQIPSTQLNAPRFGQVEHMGDDDTMTTAELLSRSQRRVNSGLQTASTVQTGQLQGADGLRGLARAYENLAGAVFDQNCAIGHIERQLNLQA